MARLTDRELDLIQQARLAPSWRNWDEVDAILIAAQQARARMMAYWIRQGLTFLASATEPVRSAIGRVILPLRRGVLRRRTVNELYRLEDRTLADIGIARDDVERLASDLALATLPPARLQAGLIARLRSWFRRRAAIRELEALDDRILADIGLQRGRIREAVARAASEALGRPATGGLLTAGPSALWAWVPVRQMAGLLGPIRRRLQRRATIRQLEALDDRILADIGLLRREIPAALDRYAAHGRSVATAPTLEQANYWDSVVRVLRNWEMSREAAREALRDDPGAAIDRDAAEDNFNRKPAAARRPGQQHRAA